MTRDIPLLEDIRKCLLTCSIERGIWWFSACPKMRIPRGTRRTPEAQVYGILIIMFAYGKYVREWLVWVDCGAGATYLSKLPFCLLLLVPACRFHSKGGREERERVCAKRF